MADFISREAANPLIPIEIAREIIQGALRQSVGMQIFTKGRRMMASEMFMPALSMLPEGAWLGSDNAIKPLTSAAWERVELIAQEYAAIVEIPDNVRNDSSFSIWQELLPRLTESYAKAFDAAVFMGIGKPLKWRSDIVTACINAGAVIAPSTNLKDDINQAMRLVEMSGYDPTAIVTGVEMKSVFRAMSVDSVGQPTAGTWLDSLSKYYLDNGAWDSTRAMMIIGDFKQAMWAPREDMNYRISEDASITHSDGKLHSLFETDSSALRVCWRSAFAIPNPINILQPNGALRFPFAIISADPAATTYDVTLTVTEGGNPVANATVKLGGMTKVTNASGVAVFESQPNQTYDYAVKVANKTRKKGTIVVTNADVAEAVVIG